nr:tRNA lysidine(34) synthetase TilS [Endobacter medicaginis]
MAGLGPWAGGPVALAVSGGADSLALAWLTQRWQAGTAQGRPDRLLGLIVDHRLRPESADEAALTARRLAAIGVESRILRLDNLGPGPAIAARARAARYTALFAACREAGAIDLLLAHHRLDQAETVAMRERAGSRERGLAAMATIAEQRDLRLVRPLLGCPPQGLREVLRAAGLGWVEDPSNADHRHTRARLRAGLRDDPDAIAALLARAAAAGSARMRGEAALADELAACCAPTAYGAVALRVAPARLSPAALSALVRWVGAGAFAPGTNALATFAARAAAGATLGGVRAVRSAGAVWLVREPAACAAPVAAADGAVWDARFRLRGRPGDGVTLGALGAQPPPRVVAHPWPKPALRAAIPALRQGARLVAVPHLGFFEPGYADLGVEPVWRDPLLGRALWP